MRVPSGKTDQNIYFVAVDSTDLKTRETGLSSFTVYRSRNGAAEVAYTTPTITEIDTTNMPGVYALLLDEDTTIASGSDSEEYCVHITQAAMAPVTRTIELYRRDTTTGRTLAVDASFRALADVDTVKTNPVVNGGTVTFPTNATLASITNITAATGIVLSGVTHSGAVIPTVTTVTNQLTAAAIATGVWQDATAGDFTVSSSIGKNLKAADTTPGSASGHFIAGTNAATSITTALTANLVGDVTGSITGNLSGSVGSVTGAVGSVTGAVGSVTGAVGSVTAATTVGTINAGVITATSIAADAITAAKVAADVGTEISAAVWDMDATGHQTQGTFGQAIGDPAADTNTIFKAVVTDAAGTNIAADIVAIKVDTAAALTRLPASLVGGRIDASVGAMAANVLTATAINTDAITADKIATAAITEIQFGLATASDLGTAQSDLDNIQTRLPTLLVGGKMDSSIGAVATNAISAAGISAAGANKVADHVLRRTYANARASADGDTLSFRSLLGAIGKLVNKWSISGGTLTVYQEDDATATAPGGTQAITSDAAADPITSLDTA